MSCVNPCDQLRAVVKLHQEELVLGVGGLEELRHRQRAISRVLFPMLPLAIEDNADRERRVFA